MTRVAKGRVGEADASLQGTRLADFPRRLIEIGCSENSKLSQSPVNSIGCECVRVTIKQDITTKITSQYFMTSHLRSKSTTRISCEGDSGTNFLHRVVQSR